MKTKTRDERIKELAAMGGTALRALAQKLGISSPGASQDELRSLILDQEWLMNLVDLKSENPVQFGFTDPPAGTEWCRRKPGSGRYHTIGFCRSWLNPMTGEYVFENCEGNEA